MNGACQESVTCRDPENLGLLGTSTRTHDPDPVSIDLAEHLVDRDLDVVHVRHEMEYTSQRTDIHRHQW